MDLRLSPFPQKLSECSFLLEVQNTADHAYIHSALLQKNAQGEVKGDKVHPLNQSLLLNHRLGKNDHSDKKTFALLDASAEIQAVIYSHWTQQPTNDFGEAESLPGDLNHILTTPVQEVDMQAINTVCFYSIASYVPGAGKHLITTLNAVLPENLTLTTLSPLRTAQDFALAKNFNTQAMCDADKKRLAIEILHARKPHPKTQGKTVPFDPVQTFHCGNGAIIAGVHTNANVHGTADAEKGLGLAVNYLYSRDPERLKEDARDFKAGTPVFAERALDFAL